MASFGNYVASKILGTEIPEGYRPYKSFAEEIAHTIADPFVAHWRESERISQLPMKEQIVEQGKRTGAILKEVAKVPLRVATSAYDAARVLPAAIAAKQYDVPYEDIAPETSRWSMPAVGDVQSYQNMTEEQITNGKGLAETILGVGGQAILETVGTGKVIEGALQNPAKNAVKARIADPTRAHGLDKLVKSGEMPKEAVYAKGNFLQPKPAQGVINDMAGQLDEYMPGLGDKLIKRLDPTKIELVNGKVPLVVKEARAVLAEEGFSTAHIANIIRSITKGSEKFKPHPSYKGEGVSSEELRTQYEMERRGEIIK